MNDVGWGVENYGTDPDIEVEIAPHDYAMGKDPQLDKAISVALIQLKKNPVKIPKFDKKPKLNLPVFNISKNGNGAAKKKSDEKSKVRFFYCQILNNKFN